MPTPGAIDRIVLPDRYARGASPRHHGDRPPQHQPERGAVPVAAAGRGGRGDAGREAAGAPLPQPPRLCAADALPDLRPPLPVPQLLHLAGRAPLPRHPALPPLRPLRAASRPLPELRRHRGPGGVRARRGAARRGGGGALARRPDDRHVERHRRRRAAPAARAGVDREGRGRHRHRHAARRQGPQFPAADAGRRGRRRSRPRLRRHARGRADLPAPEPGDRPGRAGRAAQAGHWCRPSRRSIR